MGSVVITLVNPPTGLPRHVGGGSGIVLPPTLHESNMLSGQLASRAVIITLEARVLLCLNYYTS